MAYAKRMQVVIVDDRSSVRLELRRVLQSYPNIEIVGEAADGEVALLKAGKLQPAVMVMDINMPKMDGITATRLIKAQHPAIVIIGLTVEARDYEIHAMLRAGASEVLMKDRAVNDLYTAIQRAVAAVQPILVLEESPTSQAAPAEYFREPQGDTVPIAESETERENTNVENK
jgi:DNA-binding NarL/FixJ family response regulator